MADVAFNNRLGKTAYLHLRVAAVEVPPEQRGGANATIAAGDTLSENVGDDDVWFAYGGQVIGGGDDPQLCRAAGGAVVDLDGSHPCFAR